MSGHFETVEDTGVDFKRKHRTKADSGERLGNLQVDLTKIAVRFNNGDIDSHKALNAMALRMMKALPRSDGTLIAQDQSAIANICKLLDPRS